MSIKLSQEVLVTSADEEQELARLLAQEPSPLTSGLSGLRDNGPDATQLASLASRLALQGIDVSSPQPPAGVSPWKKWGLGGLGGASAVVIWLALRGSQPAPSAEAKIEVDAQPLTASTPALEQGASPERPANVRRGRPAPTQALPATTAGPSAASNEAAASPAPTASVEAAVRTASPPDPASDVPEPARSTPGAVVAKPRAGTAASVATDPTGSDRPTAGPAAAPSELELLRDARLALHQAPARALQLTEDHARLYPRGQMTQERELIAVSALVALGRRTAALSRAASFERLYPTSPYRKQLADLLR